jgi:hypothetical protein
MNDAKNEADSGASTSNAVLGVSNKTAFEKLADALAPLMTEPYSPDCSTCANRGKVHGLSQETYCEHCIWHQAWRQDHYEPNISN